MRELKEPGHLQLSPSVPSGWSGLNFFPTFPVSVKALPAFSMTSPAIALTVEHCAMYTGRHNSQLMAGQERAGHASRRASAEALAVSMRGLLG